MCRIFLTSGGKSPILEDKSLSTIYPFILGLTVQKPCIAHAMGGESVMSAMVAINTPFTYSFTVIVRKSL
ncbi:MAG: hypothetical protein IPG90_04200 [Bacteroidetes bacterium]|nr:hypothetical protein [Bacteroidota bacterium]